MTKQQIEPLPAEGPPANAPKLKSGDDKAAAKYLVEIYEAAQNGLRSVVAAGLYCFEIKQNLKHGQFQPWLAAHCPSLSYRSLAAYMGLTKNVLEACGFKTLEPYFQKCSALHFSHGGEILLLSDAKMPEAAMPLRDKIRAVIDGKTQRQLFAEFKQVDDDDDDAKPKRGRLKGQGGASKEQRALAREREREIEIFELKKRIKDFGKECRELSDDGHIGDSVVGVEFQKVFEDVEYLFRYMQQVAAARKGGKR